MKILIAGASGFLGKELTKHLALKHQITVLGRSLGKLESTFSENITKLSWENLSNHQATAYDLIINLSGSNIGAKRWSASVKKELVASRTLTNKRLIEWLIQQKAKPRYFCANAIGIYGAQAESLNYVDESTPLPQHSQDFVQQIALAWEQALKPAQEAGIPVTSLRFGVVLKQGQGMLKKLELPFRAGLGSVIGSGKQALSWIHYKDLLRAVDFLIACPEVTGAINITAPQAITQRKFAQSFAKALGRPLLFRTPAWVIKLLFGEMGESLLLKGQKVAPKRLEELGFQFNYPEIEKALSEEYCSEKGQD